MARDAPHEREPEPEAARCGGAVERLEDALPILGGNAGTAILDGEDDLSRRVARERDRRGRSAAVSPRILEQVAHQAAEHARVATDGHRLAGHFGSPARRLL